MTNVEVIRHVAKEGDNLEGFVNSSKPVILYIRDRECLLDWISKDKAEVLYRDQNKAGGWPTEKILHVHNYRIKDLELEEPQTCYVDFSSGQNIRLNKAGIIYRGNDQRLKNNERLHKKFTGETW